MNLVKTIDGDYINIDYICEMHQSLSGRPLVKLINKEIYEVSVGVYNYILNYGKAKV